MALTKVRRDGCLEMRATNMNNDARRKIVPLHDCALKNELKLESTVRTIKARATCVKSYSMTATTGTAKMLLYRIASGQI